jgi:hypothetical protein
MLLRGLILVFVALSLLGCSKKQSAALVVAKEHIDIAATRPSSSAGPADSEPRVTVAPEIKPDEIELDGYVMNKAVRGTSKDPRATKDEQWRITVRIDDIGLSKWIQSDRAQYEKLKVGDRIRVVYYKDNYTGTVWAANIED